MDAVPHDAPVLEVLPTAPEVAARLAGLFVAAAAEAVARHGRFLVALAGGTTPLAAYRLLAKADVPWPKTHVFFGDERCVPESHPDRNDGAAREALLAHVPIPAENVHAIDAMAEDGAAKAEQDVRTILGESLRFDLVLLGMGPDGHTASLFPRHPALHEKKHLVVRLEDSPKPPPARVTFTLLLLRASRHTVLVVTGAEKRAAFRRVLAHDVDTPAALARPRDGVFTILADEAAGGSATAS